MSETCMNHIKNYWESLTTDANHFFHKKNFTEALIGYKNAMYRAEVLNNNLSDCLRLHIPFMQIYIISCNNLSNTYKELQRYNDVINIMERCIYYLLRLMTNHICNTEEIQRELQKTYINYVCFLEKYDTEKFHKNLLYKTIKEKVEQNKLEKLSRKHIQYN